MLDNIKGYQNLHPEVQKFFKAILKKHNYKAAPIEVKQCKNYLKVVMSDGEWFKYYPDMTWG